MCLECIVFIYLWVSSTFTFLPFTNRVTPTAQPSLTSRSCDTDTTNAWPWPQNAPRRDRIQREPTHAPEVLLEFYAHCKPNCWHSVLADSLKCIPVVYWFFTPFAETLRLMCTKGGLRYIQIFQGVPERVTKTERQRYSWLAATTAFKTVEGENYLTSPGRNIWRQKQSQSCGGKRFISQSTLKRFFGWKILSWHCCQTINKCIADTWKSIEKF